MDFVVPVALVEGGQAKVHELGASKRTAMLVQVRNRARGSLTLASQLSIFGKIGSFALSLFGADVVYISVLASVADRSAEDGGDANRIHSENGKLRVLLSGISASQRPSSNDEVAEVLRTIATGLFNATDQVASAVEERDGGDAAELSFLLHQLYVGGFSPDQAAADPLSSLSLPAAATESTTAGEERSRPTKRRRRGTRRPVPFSARKKRSSGNKR